MIRRVSLVAALVCIASMLAPGGAAAGTAKLVQRPDSDRGAWAAIAKVKDEPFELFEYSAAPGEVNRLVLSTTRRGGDVLVTDPAGVALGRGCARVVAGDPTRARCSSPRDLEIYALSARLGDQDDRADDTGVRIYDRSPDAAIDGGTGEDVMTGNTLRGGPGNDTLRGDYVAGGPGDDVLFAVDSPNQGRITVVDESDASNGSDVINGGRGPHDHIRYRGRTAPVTIDLRATSGAGEAGENDRIIGVEDAEGGRGDDLLIGTDAANELHGGAGTDRLSGGKGNDYLLATGADEEGNGSRGDRDRIDGGPGDDEILGSNGPNVIEAGPGQDTVGGYADDDRLRTRDRSVDFVGCDSGRRDDVRADALDFVPGSCERVGRTGIARAVPLWVSVASISRTAPDVLVGCSIDGPHECRGTVKLYRGGLRGTVAFRVRRGRAALVHFASTRLLRGLLGRRVRVVATTRRQRGHSRSAARNVLVYDSELGGRF